MNEFLCRWIAIWRLWILSVLILLKLCFLHLQMTLWAVTHLRPMYLLEVLCTSSYKLFLRMEILIFVIKGDNSGTHLEAVFGFDIVSYQVQTLVILSLDVPHGLAHLTLPEFSHLDGGITVSQDCQFLDFLKSRTQYSQWKTSVSTSRMCCEVYICRERSLTLHIALTFDRGRGLLQP